MQLRLTRCSPVIITISHFPEHCNPRRPHHLLSEYAQQLSLYIPPSLLALVIPLLASSPWVRAQRKNLHTLRWCCLLWTRDSDAVSVCVGGISQHSCARRGWLLTAWICSSGWSGGRSLLPGCVSCLQRPLLTRIYTSLIIAFSQPPCALVIVDVLWRHISNYVFFYGAYDAAYQKSQSAVFMLPRKGVPSAVVRTVRRWSYDPPEQFQLITCLLVIITCRWAWKLALPLQQMQTEVTEKQSLTCLDSRHSPCR